MLKGWSQETHSQSLPTSWVLGNLFTALHVHFFMRVLRQSNTYIYTHSCYIHMYILYWEQGAVQSQRSFEAIHLLHFVICTQTHTSKRRVYIWLRRQRATMEVLPKGFTFSKYKTIPPTEFTVHYWDKHLYHPTSNGPSHTGCKWATHAECHLFSALVLKNSCHHMLTELHDSLCLAEKVLLQINSGSFWQFCIRFGNSPLSFNSHLLRGKYSEWLPNW